MDGVKRRLGGGAIAPHPGCCGHAGGKRAARLALQIDAETMGVLSVLEKEPGAGEGLLTGGAGVAAGLIFICQKERTHREKTLDGDLTGTDKRSSLVIRNIQ